MNQLWTILAKDLRIEWRTKTRIFGLVCYAATLLLLFAFAVGPDRQALQDHASAYVWMSVVSVSTLLLAQSFQQEVESDALEGMLLIPVKPWAIFYGKAIANTLWLLILALFTLPIAVVLFELNPGAAPVGFFAVLFMGCSGIAAPGSLYSGLTARLSSQQLMLPVFLFPLVVPTVLAAVKATNLLCNGDPMGQATSWLGVLVALNLLYWSLCGFLFSKVID